MNRLARLFRIPATGEGRAGALSAVENFLRRMEPGLAYVVEISEWRPTRTNAQNAYLWGAVYRHILQVGGEQLRGWTPEDLHEYCLGEWGGWEIVEAFGRKRARPLKRSSKMNKQEFSDYVEFIKQRMAEHGIVVPEAA